LNTLFGVEGGEVGLIAGAVTMAGVAYDKANLALNKVDNLVVSTTQDKIDTSKYILNTSNAILQSLENLPYEKLSVPLKDLIVEEDILSEERFYPPFKKCISK